MSENPPDPWRGDDGEDFVARYARFLSDWADRYVASTEAHYATLQKIDERYHRRSKFIICFGVGWVCLGLGIHLGEKAYDQAAWLLGYCGLGLCTGYMLSRVTEAFAHWVAARQNAKLIGPKEWRCPQCKQARWHKMDCTNQERNR